jgi:hypothetical protein
MELDLDRLLVDTHLSLDRLAAITDIFIDRLRDDDWDEIPRSAAIDRVALMLTHHPQLSIELATNIFPFYPALVLTHPSFTEWLASEPDLLDRLFWLDPQIFFYRDNLPDFFLQWAIVHDRSIVRAGVAESDRISPLALDLLASDPEESVIKAVANNPLTLTATLDRLAAHSAKEVRARVAIHPHTSVSTLVKLAADTNKIVRSRVAENTRTPGDTLLKLALDPTHGVRRFVAANPHTPITALAQLAGDIDPRSPSACAANPQISTDL